MSKQILKILLIFVCCSILLAPVKNGYADSILGTGVNIQTDGKTGHGTLKINSIVYKAPNLTIKMGNTIKISGDVFSGNEKSKLAISGIKVKDTLYEFTGFVIGKSGMTTVKLDLYWVSSNPKTVGSTKSIPVNPSTQKTTQMNQIKLVVNSFDKAIVGYSYGFAVKTFDKKSNPTGNFDQNEGKIPGVKITVIIKDKNNNILKTFNGLTDNQGYYSDSEGIVNYVPNVTYNVIFNATKSGYLSDSVIKSVFVQSSGTR